MNFRRADDDLYCDNVPALITSMVVNRTDGDVTLGKCFFHVKEGKECPIEGASIKWRNFSNLGTAHPVVKAGVMISLKPGDKRPTPMAMERSKESKANEKELQKRTTQRPGIVRGKVARELTKDGVHDEDNKEDVEDDNEAKKDEAEDDREEMTAPKNRHYEGNQGEEQDTLPRSESEGFPRKRERRAEVGA